MGKIKIGMLTGGGDAPGLNSVIYSFVKTCYNMIPECEIIGYKFGYKGLYNNEFIPLTPDTVSGILNRGGTILQSSNKDNLFDYQVTDENGNKVKKNVSHVAVENMKKDGVDVLVILGGDGTLTSGRDFSNMGVKVIGVPKTIDNDLGATDTTFGFDTSVNIITENLGRVHTTAESHQRVIVVEVMGRDTGWLALYSGVAGSADAILIPEIPYSIEHVAEKIRRRDAEGKKFSIVVVAEGAKELGGEVVISKVVADSPDPIRLGGIGAHVAAQLEKVVDHEVRSVQLGHIQRGGEPSPADRILSCRYGAHAAQMLKNGIFGEMVCLKDGDMTSENLNTVIEKKKYVTNDLEMVKVARGLGISFGDK